MQNELALTDELPLVRLGKTRSHQIYKNKKGTRLPGVTTILGVRAKPALTSWAYNMGLQKINIEAYTRDMAETGTLLHGMVVASFRGQQVDMTEWTPEQQDRAAVCMAKFRGWRERYDLKLLEAEIELVSEEYGYGGTCDLYLTLDGKHTLIDIKTSKAIYDDHVLQLIAYEGLLRENGYKVEQRGILRLGRTPEEGFEWRLTEPTEDLWKLVLLCQEMYNANKRAFGRGY